MGTAMDVSRESAIVAGVVKRLKARGAWVLKVHGGGYQRPGVADVLGVYEGVPLALECKRPGQKPTPLQERDMVAFRRAGGRAEVITAAEQVDGILAAIDEVAA